MAKRTHAKTILLTGFEPFGKHRVNSSWVAVSALDGRTIAGRRIKCLLLPVTFRKPLRLVRNAIRRLRPQMVILFGLRDRPRIGIERTALNLNKETILVGGRRKTCWSQTRRGGPVGYWPTIAVEDIERALRRARLPVEASPHAGSYICNHVFYGTLDFLQRQRWRIPCGFIHVPPLKTERTKHGLTEERLRRCAEIVVCAALRARRHG